MMKKYRLAKQVIHENGNVDFLPFGPLFTLAKAESYCNDMVKGGFDIVVLNVLTD